MSFIIMLLCGFTWLGDALKVGGSGQKTSSTISLMGLFSFLGGFAVFNAICDLFAGKPKQPVYMPPQRHYIDLDYADYPNAKTSSSDVDALQNRIDELELLLAETDVMSGSYDEIQDRIDALQDRIDCLEEIEDIKDELDYLQDELSDLELERDLYDDLDADW